MFMKMPHTVLTLLLFSSSFASATEIELKSGKKFEAVVLKVFDDEVSVLQQIGKETIQTTEDGTFARSSILATHAIPIEQVERIGKVSPSSFSSIFSYNLGFRFASTLETFLIAISGKPFLTQLKVWIVFVVLMIFGIAGVLFAIGFAIPGARFGYLSAVIFVVLSGAFLLGMSRISMLLLLSWGAFGSNGLQILASLLIIAIFGLLSQILSRFTFVHGVVAIIVTYFAFQGLLIALSRIFNLWVVV
jgi:hypothetical protein